MTYTKKVISRAQQQYEGKETYKESDIYVFFTLTNELDYNQQQKNSKNKKPIPYDLVIEVYPTKWKGKKKAFLQEKHDIRGKILDEIKDLALSRVKEMKKRIDQL